MSVIPTTVDVVTILWERTSLIPELLIKLKMPMEILSAITMMNPSNQRV